MKLRDHPMMHYQGVKNWPPLWKCARGGAIPTVKGEVGVLTYVHSNARLSSRLSLVMDYEAETYVGTLIFDNQAFCKQVSDVLRLHLNRPIKDLGDLDLV